MTRRPGIPLAAPGARRVAPPPPALIPPSHFHLWQEVPATVRQV